MTDGVAKTKVAGISEKTRRKLWGVSGNVCAFPGCNLRVVERLADTDRTSVVGEECHIVAQSPKATRGVESLTDDEKRDWSHIVDGINRYDNLVVLCSVHHTIIDDKEQGFTVAKIVQMKKRHEALHTGPVSTVPGVLPHLPDDERAPLQEGIEQALSSLRKRDDALAHQLDSYLANRSLEDLVNAVRVSEAWVQGGTVNQWEALGSILTAIGEFGLAERCYLCGAEHVECTEPTRFWSGRAPAHPRQVTNHGRRGYSNRQWSLGQTSLWSLSTSAGCRCAMMPKGQSRR